MSKAKLFRPVAEFIETLENAGGTPLYELTPQQARDVLKSAQAGSVKTPEADIDSFELSMPDQSSVPVKIVRPHGHTEPLPVVFYIHGGGWVMGNFDTHKRLVSELAAKIPAAVVFPVYTPSPEAKYPQPLHELFTVLEHIVENGVKYRLDASRLAIAGDSVGGNMAAALTIMAKEKGFRPKIDFQLLLYPVTAADFENGSYTEFENGPWLTKKAMEWFWDAYTPNEKQREDILCCPLNADVDRLTGLPPALVITDENDVLRDEGEAYARKLNQAGVDVALVRFGGTIHDFMMLNALSETPPTRTAVSLAVSALQQVLR